MCLLDPDGDIADHLDQQGQGQWSDSWACYHSQMLLTTIGNQQVGIVPRAVGGPYAVLVAEQLAAAGCQLLLSITSAGQLAPLATPPYFVLITHAIRDEGTSYHYLPADADPRLSDDLAQDLRHVDPPGVDVHAGRSWTTDAPFRETASAVHRHTADGLAAVEMEAASLYAYATATGNKVVCFAHVTNQMARIDNDFEKGEHNGAVDALTLIETVLETLHTH